MSSAAIHCNFNVHGPFVQVVIWSLFNGFYWYLSCSILSCPEYPIQSNEGGKGLSFEPHYACCYNNVQSNLGTC